MSTAQHRRLAKKKRKRLLRIAQPSNELKKKECGGAGPREEVERPRCWSRPTRGGGVELQNTQTDWSGVGGVEWSWWSGVAVLGVECSQTGP